MKAPKLTAAQWKLVHAVLAWENCGPSEVRESMTARQSDSLDRAREMICDAIHGGEPLERDCAHEPGSTPGTSTCTNCAFVPPCATQEEMESRHGTPYEFRNALWRARITLTDEEIEAADRQYFHDFMGAP